MFPHQIFEDCELLRAVDPSGTVIYLLEEYLFFRQYRFHKQKLVLHRASMTFYAEYLRSKGFRVVYVESKDLPESDSLKKFINAHAFSEISYTYTVDDWLEKRLKKAVEGKGVPCTMYESPLFLTTRSDLDEYKAQTKRPYFMKNFYEWQRKRVGVMVDENGEPEGGRWSYDSDNRKKLPKDVVIPAEVHVPHNHHVTEALEYVEKNFSHHVGSLDKFNYATDFDGVRACIDGFMKDRLANFGPYEDAIDQRSHTLFHSVLSPYLNAGLIQPSYVLEKVLAYSRKHPNAIPIESLEGFVRQLIGWREYMRLVYEDLGVKIRNGNYFGATRKLPGSFWTGETGIDPIDHTIRVIRDTAYCHHIPRLMVLGNFMNLCGFDPNDVYEWFMEMFIDSYDWVMVANVYSMALYADGGLITTKPYISSSNYVRKMSDYGNDSGWAEKWDALYWSFIDSHYEKLKGENRLGFVGVQYQKMGAQKVGDYKKLAEETILGL